VKCYAVLAVVAVVILATTGVWNPWPGLWAQVDQSSPLAEPSAAWQQRLGGAAQSVTLAGGAVVVEFRTETAALSLNTGVRLWERPADWSAVAGSGVDSVVVTGQLLHSGYEVLDPASGAVRRTDTEAAAVWTYDDALVDLRCAGSGDCLLRAWDPRGSRPLWTVPTSGMGFVLYADNPDLLGTEPLGNPQVDEHAGGPAPMPGLIGVPTDGKVHVVDTAVGRVVRVLDPEREQRVAVTGGRVLTVTAEAGDGTCYYSVAATEPSTGRRVWQRDGLNLRTADTAGGCRQDRDPAGGYTVVLGVDPVGRQELIDAHDGRVLWHGDKREKVLAVDDGYAVIRDADPGGVQVRSFSRDRTVWRRSVDRKAQVALTPYAVVVVGTGPRRVTALDPAGGAVLAEARTAGRVLAVGSGGMIVGEGRDLAYVRFSGGSADR
jgi:hypothetical protein